MSSMRHTALALAQRIWQKPPRCCGSSVVEHIIGNDEVGSSILPRSTIKINDKCKADLFEFALVCSWQPDETNFFFAPSRQRWNHG